VTLAFESDTKKHELSEKMKEVYNILCNGRKIYSNLSEEEYFNIMEDLADEFYQTGSPNPNEIETEIIGE
jgi:hypothetical protein